MCTLYLCRYQPIVIFLYVSNHFGHCIISVNISNLQEKLYGELMEVALKKQSEIQQIIVGAIASERNNVLQLASDFQFDCIILHYTFYAMHLFSYVCLFHTYFRVRTAVCKSSKVSASILSPVSLSVCL